MGDGGAARQEIRRSRRARAQQGPWPLVDLQRADAVRLQLGCRRAPSAGRADVGPFRGRSRDLTAVAATGVPGAQVLDTF